MVKKKKRANFKKFRPKLLEVAHALGVDLSQGITDLNLLIAVRNGLGLKRRVPFEDWALRDMARQLIKTAIDTRVVSKTI